MKPAFVVIDMNIDFFEESPALMERKDFLVKNINDLAAYFRDKKIPVIWIRQEFKADLSDV
ncbi:MAG: Aldehyde dehydrogenase [Parcubacteria group bacterium GW2011_GWF2_44_7]|nr:MAG: Aldehyde dehydrogenase [Parcubacteria group bacterium GW2011_GWF2_44_7]